MRFRFLLMSALLLTACRSAPPAAVDESAGDWLVDAIHVPATASWSADGSTLVLSNGLAERTFTLRPHPAADGLRAIGTTSMRNLSSSEEFIRAVEPEAVIEIEGKRILVGGLAGQLNRAFLRSPDVEQLRADPASMPLFDIETGPIPARMPWKQPRWSTNSIWPPAGLRATLIFGPAEGSKNRFRVLVHYDLYEGLPLLAKTVVVDAGAQSGTFVLQGIESERLAIVEAQSSVEQPGRWLESNLHVESEMGMFGQANQTGRPAVRWEQDPAYTTQVNYELKTPCLLVCGPPLGPGVELGPWNERHPLRQTVLAAPTVYELLLDTHERERRGLSRRRMYRTIAPWSTENPILMHARHSDPDAVRLAIDQCAEVGFEMLILSFGSGFDMESTDPAYRARIRELVDYGRAKGVELGGYSLLASRAVSAEDDVLAAGTLARGKAIFGNSPCLMSAWGQAYFQRIESFLAETGMMVLEHDGSYPGDVCASEQHPGHTGLADSQWRQWRGIMDFYARCRGRGIYLNVPDWYFLGGANKCAMGYRETNWSLPRAEQILHGRQNIYDGTWDKTPSMGWMFVPLTEYQGGGAAATIEPLREHLEAYEAHLANNFGAGVQACWRGPRLYDSEETKALVKRWVDFYLEHRRILDSDVIHLRRADGRDWDGWLHVDPHGRERGLAMLYNPTGSAIERELELPLYYTGLRERARVESCFQVVPPMEVRIDQQGRARVSVSIPAHGRLGLIFTAP
jgi:hypothetical protein